MLKFENVAKVGDIIRAYDFKPCAGRDDAFIEGVVEDVANKDMGYVAYKVKVTADKFERYETVAGDENRVGRVFYVPYEVSFMEFDSRIINLSNI